MNNDDIDFEILAIATAVLIIVLCGILRALFLG